MQCPICGSELKRLPLRWFPDRRVLVRGDIAATLSPSEATVFQLLWDAAHTGRAVNSGALFDALYGEDPNGGPGKNALPMHLSNVRKLIAPVGIAIKTVHGMYSLRIEKDGSKKWPR